MITREVTVRNRAGVHTRPASMIVREASRFASEFFIRKDGYEINGKSIIGVMTLAAEQGSTLDLLFDGPDEAEAADALGDALRDRVPRGPVSGPADAAASADPTAPVAPAGAEGEVRVDGIGVAPGVAIGPAALYVGGGYDAEPEQIAPDAVDGRGGALRGGRRPQRARAGARHDRRPREARRRLGRHLRRAGAHPPRPQLLRRRRGAHPRRARPRGLGRADRPRRHPAAPRSRPERGHARARRRLPRRPEPPAAQPPEGARPRPRRARHGRLRRRT